MAEDEIAARDEDTFSYLDNSGGVTKDRNQMKHNCYVMTLSGKDISDELKALPVAVEEGLNKIKDSTAAGGLHAKSVYKRYTMDFFKG